MLIWTRAISDWQDDLKLFAPDERIFRLPCLSFKALPCPAFALNKQKSLISAFTSARSVQFALAHANLRETLSSCTRHYAVGAATAQALQSAGFTPSLSPSVQNAADLASLIIATEPNGSQILLPGARERAYPLAERLQEAGFFALSLPLYETQKGLHNLQSELLSQDQALSTLEQLASGVLCFASPSAVEGFVKAALLSPAALARFVSWPVAAIGTTTAASCQAYFREVALSPRPDLAALIELARELALKIR